MKPIRFTRALTTLLTVLVLLSLGSTQAIYDKSTTSFAKDRKHAILAANEPLLPSVATLKALSLGNRSALADYIWIQTIQYFGGGSAYAHYPALGGMLDTVTQLDPKFAFPYEFSLIVLPFMNQAEKARDIGERGQVEVPGNGLQTFYLASVYQLNLHDYKKAAFYYEKAAKEPDAPNSASQLAGVSLAKVNDTLNDREVALDFWKTVYENATSDSEKERAKNWFEHMQIVYSLELAAQQYKTEHGSYPDSLQTLVDRRYISSIPKSPINRVLEYHADTGKISFDQLASDDESE